MTVTAGDGSDTPRTPPLVTKCPEFREYEMELWSTPRTDDEIQAYVHAILRAAARGAVKNRNPHDPESDWCVGLPRSRVKGTANSGSPMGTGKRMVWQFTATPANPQWDRTSRTRNGLVRHCAGATNTSSAVQFLDGPPIRIRDGRRGAPAW